MSAEPSKRTQRINHAIEAVTNNIIEYPSTPYTANSAATLSDLLTALDKSTKIDEAANLDVDPRLWEAHSLEDVAATYEYYRDRGSSAADAMSKAINKLRPQKETE